MKKLMIMLLMVVATITASFAKGSNEMTAKLVAAKNGVYKVKTSFGTFNINMRKATVTKL